MTKEKVLGFFELHKGTIISGSELADTLGISRTAVWKAINSLRDEGYDIEAIKKKGYRLNENSDILSVIKISNRLLSHIYDLNLYKTVDSTNKVAMCMGIQGAKEWTVVASEKQEEGKGRQNTFFDSPEGKGIYMSVLLRPQVHCRHREALIAFIGSAVEKSIQQYTNAQIEVSNTEGIVYEGRKIGGILTEAQVELETGRIESIVIGIGISIYNTIEEKVSVISLSEIMGCYCNRSELIAEILNELMPRYNVFVESTRRNNDE